MRPWLRIPFLLAFIIFGGANIAAQTADEIALAELYDTFESTVKNNDRDGHLSLYVHPYVPLYVVIEGSPSLCCSENATQWANQIASTNNNLTINNIEFEIYNGIASSVADYTGFGTGLDLFGYIKTNVGWKYVILHSTGDPIRGRRTLPNTLEDVLNGLNTTISSQEEQNNFIDLFASSSTPFFTFASTFNEEFSFNKHSVESFLGFTDSTSTNISFEFKNPDIRVEDLYTARIWGDYKITTIDTVETGRALIFMFATGANGWKISTFIGTNQISTSIKEQVLPQAFTLQQNYPNPFNPSTKISYNLKDASHVTLQIFDISGKLIKTLWDANQSAGDHISFWDGRNETENEAAAGIYFYTLKNEGNILTKRMLLIR